MRLPSKRALEELIGDKPPGWAGHCHQAAEAVVVLMGADRARVRRGRFVGEIAPESYFVRWGYRDHSWVELTDGRVLDPTRFAFVGGRSWPLWVGSADDYEIGGWQPGERCPTGPVDR